MKRKEFKFLEDSIYLDHGAGALKPKSVIAAGVEFYEKYSINPHSADSEKGVWVANKIRNARQLTADLSNAKYEEVIFTSGTTEALNRISRMLEGEVNKGDEIILSALNHAANVIPWIELSKRTGAKLVWAENIVESITDKTKIIAVAEINNTIENEKDMKTIYEAASSKNIFVINDAAQAISHKKINFDYADFVVYSSNKLYGPTGTGVMLMSKELQDKLPKVRFGGGANATFSTCDWVAHNGFAAREAGTPNTAGIIMHGAAIKFINSIGFEKIMAHEKEISKYAYDQLSTVENIIFASKRGENNIVFNIGNVNSQDVVSHLGHKGIILRSGQHCVRLIKTVTGQDSWIRASIGLYSEKSDIDAMVEAIKNGGDFLEFI